MKEDRILYKKNYSLKNCVCECNIINRHILVLQSKSKSFINVAFFIGSWFLYYTPHRWRLYSFTTNNSREYSVGFLHIAECIQLDKIFVWGVYQEHGEVSLAEKRLTISNRSSKFKHRRVHRHPSKRDFTTEKINIISSFNRWKSIG